MIVELHVIGNALLQLVVLLFALKGVIVRRVTLQLDNVCRHWNVHVSSWLCTNTCT